MDYSCISSAIEKIVSTFLVNELYSKLRVHNNLYLVNKMKQESKNITEQEIQEIIDKAVMLCDIARKKGFYHLIEYSNLFESQFVKDMLYALSEDGCKKLEWSCWLKMTSVFLPYLKTEKLVGKNFMEAVLLYEGILLSCNMYNPSQVKYSLNLLLGRLLEFDELFDEKYKATFPIEREGMPMSEDILNQIESRIYDVVLTLEEDYRYVKFSIVNHEEIYKKYQEELKKVSEDIKVDILKRVLNNLTNFINDGKASIFNNIHSVFQRNLLKMMENGSMSYGENVQLSEYCLSYFLNCKEKESAYLEDILYYEAFIMFANGYSFSMIQYRLYGMIGMNIPFIEC